ncbi:hypothetical protein CFK37_00035 [Virgibacillus phasianinus]|uniref:DUF4309 domain-containing protein n=1 Tax=Virgibacillus phasianinus TaxID=2017483 RepID=A0A220TY73_9BACI|nr:YjgB family protein [Virgibacillus phasianinus]ASK60709.1 hypothetical protein CFK37_00035 [Virgibacillus phasianinus]
MRSTKPVVKVIAASVLTGSVLVGVPSLAGSVHATSNQAEISHHTNQNAVGYLNEIYHSAFEGEMPGYVQGLNINQATKKEVHNKLGNPGMVDHQFELYGWEMGQAGHGFSYNKDNTIAEIRNFGTGVERQTNLGRITPDLLGNQLGTADKILNVPGTDETDYVYQTGDYELHFVIGDNDIIKGFDQTVNHVNLKKAE